MTDKADLSGLRGDFSLGLGLINVFSLVNLHKGLIELLKLHIELFRPVGGSVTLSLWKLCWTEYNNDSILNLRD